jgi:hypothetical protein
MATSQNTPVLIGGSLSTSIKTANVNKLSQFSQKTGYSLSSILDRAAEQWLAIEAPVYLDYVKRNA